MSARPDRQRLPNGIPAVLDLTAGRRVQRSPAGLAEIILVSQAQLTEALRGVDRVGELPRSARRPLVQFVPFGAGYIGVPLCSPSGDGRTCWPIKGGPDDNPLAWICACRVEPDRELNPLPATCYLDFTSAPFRLRCIRGTCTRTCRLAAASVGKGALRGFQVGCSCR
jgi:hypothetical protein